jgi:hypothetical protein
MTNAPRHINDILQEIVANESIINGRLGDLVDALHERGFGILVFLFALPMALPLPVPPGVNLLFAVPLLLLTFQQSYGAKRPWLPKKLRQKNFNADKVKTMLLKSKPWLDRMSVLIRPRLGWMTQGLFSKLIGVFGFMFALCICIPIPLTNTVPSFAILLMALCILMRDGLAVLAGMVIGSLWIMLLATLGVEGFKALLSIIF